jgi:hypothetical protein
MTISELRVELQAVESAEKGSFVSTTVPDVVRKADKVYKMIPV